MPADPAAAGKSSTSTGVPASARVFLALWPPEALASQLSSIAQQLAAISSGRPARQETLHLTLAFLGDIAETRLPELCRVASAIQAPAFTLQIDKLDFWSHNHLLWAGCCQPPPALGELVDELHRALIKAGFDLPGLARHFVPHISLVRRVPVSESPLLLRPEPGLSLSAWSCRQFVLVRSCPSPNGADYRVVATFALAANSTSG